MLKVAPLSG